MLDIPSPGSAFVSFSVPLALAFVAPRMFVFLFFSKLFFFLFISILLLLLSNFLLLSLSIDFSHVASKEEVASLIDVFVCFVFAAAAGPGEQQ